MKKKVINIQVYIFLIFLSYFTILFLSAVNSHGFLADEVAASVDNTPITLNELYFLYNFNMINHLKYRKINQTVNNTELRQTLNFYINRMLILNQEKKTGGTKVSESSINLLTADFKKKFKFLHKRTSFNLFLEMFGLNEIDFRAFAENILIEKIFINERLSFFMLTLENREKISTNAKQKRNKELSLELRNLLLKLKSNAKIQINNNFN